MTTPDRYSSTDLGHAADWLRRAGELDGARELYTRALARCEAVGDDTGAAECREGLGRTALEAEDYETGLEYLLLAYGHYSSHGDEIAAARSSYRALLPLVMRGRYTEARALLTANVETLRRHEDELFPWGVCSPSRRSSSAGSATPRARVTTSSARGRCSGWPGRWRGPRSSTINSAAVATRSDAGRAGEPTCRRR